MNNQQPDNVPEGSEASVTRASGNGNEASIPQAPQSLVKESSGSREVVESDASRLSLVRMATGPRTVEGKQRTKRNALKHGVFSEIALLKGESHAKYDSLLDGLREALQPKGKLEEVLVEKLTTNLWRQRRLIRAEGVVMQWEQQTRERGEVADDLSTVAKLLGHDRGDITNIDDPFALKMCLGVLVDLRC